MKRMLVVLVGRDPVQTDALFERTLGCLAAEEQLRKAYRDALSAALAFEYRRDYARARQLQARKLDNSRTCMHTPHRRRAAKYLVTDLRSACLDVVSQPVPLTKTPT